MGRFPIVITGVYLILGEFRLCQSFYIAIDLTSPLALCDPHCHVRIPYRIQTIKM